MKLENIPTELKALPQWVNRRGKVPYNPDTDKPAKAGQPDTWVSFDKATAAASRYDGIGFEFADGGGIVGIDLDHVVHNGVIEEWAWDLVKRLNSYTEYSPSGTGLHIFVKGKLPENGRKKEIDKTTRQAVELYQAGRYFTVTGEALGDCRTIEPRQKELDELWADLFPVEAPRPATAPPVPLYGKDYLAEGLKKDQKLIAIWNGYRASTDESANDQAFMNKLAYWCNRNVEQMIQAFLSSPYASQKDDQHWKKAAERKDYLLRTATKAAKDCTRTAAEIDEAFQREQAKKAFSQADGAAKNDLPEFFDGRRFLHNVMGDYLIKKHGVCKINGSVHIYDNGIYKPGEETLHGFMIQLIPSLTDSRRKEVYKYIKASLGTPEKEVSPPHLIPFAHQIYDLQNDRFFDYTPDHVFLNRFPYDYKPNAPICDSITSTIARIAGDDQEVIRLLYEAIGNCFYLLNSFRGAVMLYGRSGSNGKSTLLNMITRLLGKENASFLSLQDTAERFRLVEVYGKAANIGDDIPNTYLPESSIFKKLVTGEIVTAEKKGQDPFSFKPYAKMFFAMNGLPAVSDKSKAFFSRILLIPLNQDFSQSNTRDVKLKDRVWSQQEMECLTRLAVEGLKRLISQGDFTRPECVKKAVEEYEAENNPVREFLAETGSVLNHPTQEIYDRYRLWCAQSGHKNTMTRIKFTKEVRTETGFAIKNMRTRYSSGEVAKCFYSPEDVADTVADCNGL